MAHYSSSSAHANHVYEALAPYVRVEKHLATLAVGVDRLKFQRPEQLARAQRLLQDAYHALVSSYTRYIASYESNYGVRVAGGTGKLSSIRGGKIPKTFEAAIDDAAKLVKSVNELGLLPGAHTGSVVAPLKRLIDTLVHEEQYIMG